MNRAIRRLWTAQIQGKRGKKETEGKLLSHPRAGDRVLGVDPSLRGTGVAVVRMEEKGHFHLDYSKTLSWPSAYTFFDCLRSLFESLTEVVTTFKIHSAALEQTIFVQSVSVAQKLGASRGAIGAAIAVRGIPIYEYLPLRVKKSVVGYGRANKIQVAKMVRALLGLQEELAHDESDAAAVALCHLFNFRKNYPGSG
jgi:crossover junction endodeoxyribonuclease RuvC